MFYSSVKILTIHISLFHVELSGNMGNLNFEGQDEEELEDGFLQSQLPEHACKFVITLRRWLMMSLA